MLFLLIPLFFCSCEPEAVRDGRKIYKSYFKYILKDPSSLVVYHEEYTLLEEDGKVKWEINYGAKNSYGGMVRNTIEFTTYYDRYIKIDPLYGGEWYNKNMLN